MFTPSDVEKVVYVVDKANAALATTSQLLSIKGSRTVDSFGDAFIERTGYLGWADANQLIILFPQISLFLPKSAGLIK